MSLSVWCLGQDVEFHYIGFWWLPFYLLYIRLIPILRHFNYFSFLLGAEGGLRVLFISGTLFILLFSLYLSVLYRIITILRYFLQSIDRKWPKSKPVLRILQFLTLIALSLCPFSNCFRQIWFCRIKYRQHNFLLARLVPESVWETLKCTHIWLVV